MSEMSSVVFAKVTIQHRIVLSALLATIVHAQRAVSLTDSD